MKRLLWIVPYLGLLLTGCNTTILVASGKEFSDYQKSIKSYGEYWVKEGGTVEQKRRDSWACGAAPNITSADRPDFTPAEIQAAKCTEDPNDIAAIHRLRQAWGECMKSKGYEYRRTSP
ncbi:MAG: hypothetical protein KKF85_09115 [Gammaproteobacteria bacterium]|nr:hypothetical protein [Rhodocyclaceae bacterium]MBU3909056.1 hypothetical protein [Gammaproteobacteria bacterium]MBU3990363.1 hypothetical protein [Gammaproteobacteria bacterium]MBU4003043.1 hypothetical protein [Gammaproteobacteria bacterium]MBU4019888.1 hypothetical protein [Gammaproteobacteria bacterium]